MNNFRKVQENDILFVRKQLEKLDDNFMDYICYWEEKYYKNGFCDGVEIVSVCIID